MTRFLLIRHALTDAVGKIISGRMEGVSLSPEGTSQAGKLATRLSRVRVDAIYSSPLERALKTAAPLAGMLKLQPIICEDFNEVDFGEWTNCTLESISHQPAFKLFNSFRSCTRIPGGELMAEAQLRIVKGLEKLRLQHDDQTIVVVTHGDLIKAAVAYYAGIHLDMFQRIEISPASITIIEIHEEIVRLLVINDTGEIGSLARGVA